MNFTKLDRYLETLEGTYGVKGLDLKVMQDHKEIYRRQIGVADYAGKKPVSADDLYDLYSCTKVITMTASMIAVEQGLFSIDDEAGKYIPSFENMAVSEECWPMQFGRFKMPALADKQHPAPTKVTLRQLMSMTSGLSYDLNSEAIKEAIAADPHAGTVTLANAIGRMPLLFDPGTHYSYSLGHDIMAAIIEVTSGMRYADFLQKYIFEPLGLKNMMMHVPAELKGRLSAQYSNNMRTGEVTEADTGNQYRLTDRYDSGGAGLAASVDDYSAVIDALACGGVAKNGYRLLTQESIDQMRTPQLNPDALENFAPSGGPMKMHAGYSYGLGVRTLIDPKESKSPVGEFGWDGAAGAYALIDPSNRLSIFYAQEVLGMIKAYTEVHPTIRDLVYEGLAE